METVFAEFVVFGDFLVDGVGADVGGNLVGRLLVWVVVDWGRWALRTVLW